MIVNVDEDGNVNPREITQESEHWRAAVYARLGTTARKTNEIQAFQLQEFRDLKNKVRRVEQVLRTLQYAPARRRGDGDINPDNRTTRAGTVIRTGAPVVQDTRPATLSPRPKLLAQLWDEWINGIGGRLPAKEFTAEQRGKCRAVFSQRKVFWDCMERQID